MDTPRLDKLAVEAVLAGDNSRAAVWIPALVVAFKADFARVVQDFEQVAKKVLDALEAKQAEVEEAARKPEGLTTRGHDTATQIFFYEHEFYVLSNFSAFQLAWKGHVFQTSEAAYHWEKFPDDPGIQQLILNAPSAHEALKIATQYRRHQRPDWGSVKVAVMHTILCAKAEQHEYVRRKLLETGDRDLVEDSWRDDFWGWGADRKGENWMGKLWMRIRKDLRGKIASGEVVVPSTASLSPIERLACELRNAWCMAGFGDKGASWSALTPAGKKTWLEVAAVAYKIPATDTANNIDTKKGTT